MNRDSTTIQRRLFVESRFLSGTPSLFSPFPSDRKPSPTENRPTGNPSAKLPIHGQQFPRSSPAPAPTEMERERQRRGEMAERDQEPLPKKTKVVDDWPFDDEGGYKVF